MEGKATAIGGMHVAVSVFVAWGCAVSFLLYFCCALMIGRTKGQGLVANQDSSSGRAPGTAAEKLAAKQPGSLAAN
jgi:hypothetical protein